MLVKCLNFGTLSSPNYDFFKEMDFVQNIIDVVTTLGQIQNFIEESNEIHKIIKCAKCPCPV